MKTHDLIRPLLILILVLVLTPMTNSVLAVDEADTSQIQINVSLDDFNRNEAYDLILSQNQNQELPTELDMLNLSRRIWISKRYELTNDTVKAGIELLDASEKRNDNKYILEALDALAYIDYYNLNNDLALKKWDTVATIAIRENMPNELYRYYNGIALLAVDEKDYEYAIMHYKKALEITELNNITGPDGSNVSALLYLNLSDLYFIRGDYSSAIDANEKALKLTPENDIESRFEIYLYLANNHHLNGDYQEAKQYIEKAKILKLKVSDRLLNKAFPQRMGSLEAAIAYVNGSTDEAANLFYQEYIREKQSVESILDVNIETQNIASSYETSSIEQQVNLLTQLKKEQTEKLVAQNILLAITVVSICLLIMVLIKKVKNLKEQKALKELLFRTSTTDQLTQIKNRKGIIEDLNSTLPGSRSIALLDIDGFKQVNDTFGHVMGDTVLKRVAETITASIRDVDEVGRYGGEEFLLLFATDDLNTAIAIAERVRTNIEQLEWAVQGLKTTVSIGLVFSAELTGDQLISEADIRLYESKNNGRNKVTAAQV